MSFKWTVLIALFAAYPLAAHHGTTGADTSKKVTLQGVVTKTEWSNPHVILHMDIKDGQGQMLSWLVSIAPPNALKRAGLTQDSIKEGAELTVEVFVAKDGTRTATAAGFLTLPNGKKLDQSGGLGFQPGGTPVVPTPAAKQ